ncbi:MAG: hypothetical protein VX694_06350 [Planctomycetota bacterium]|nr:hypothetical protein [Planctomycetota bacterium]
MRRIVRSRDLRTQQVASLVERRVSAKKHSSSVRREIAVAGLLPDAELIALTRMRKGAT